MKKKVLASLLTVAMAAILSVAALLTMTACGAKTEPTATTAAPAAAVTTAPTEAAAEAPAAEKVTGSVCLAGSTSMQKLCEAMMESFEFLILLIHFTPIHIVGCRILSPLKPVHCI